MVKDYNKDIHLTLDDMVVLFDPRTKPQLQAVFITFGISHVETYRSPSQKAGRPNNLYFRRQVEQAIRHVESFRLEPVTSAAAANV